MAGGNNMGDPLYKGPNQRVKTQGSMKQNGKSRHWSRSNSRKEKNLGFNSHVIKAGDKRRKKLLKLIFTTAELKTLHSFT